MRLMLLLMQLLMGISTRRYLPAIGTAGLLRLAVNGYNLDPAPPPRMMDNVLVEILIVRLFTGNAIYLSDWYKVMYC